VTNSRDVSFTKRVAHCDQSARISEQTRLLDSAAATSHCRHCRRRRCCCCCCGLITSCKCSIMLIVPRLARTKSVAAVNSNYDKPLPRRAHPACPSPRRSSHRSVAWFTAAGRPDASGSQTTLYTIRVAYISFRHHVAVCNLVHRPLVRVWRPESDSTYRATL